MGVVYTNVDGDQPGVIMNIYRMVKGMGLKPVLCGNIKGLQDPYRNPTTQQAFATQWGQKPDMVASFADGSKMSYEQAIIANATAMRVAKRGMHGPTVPPNTTIKEVVNLFPLEDVLNGSRHCRLCSRHKRAGAGCFCTCYYRRPGPAMVFEIV